LLLLPPAPWDSQQSKGQPSRVNPGVPDGLTGAPNPLGHRVRTLTLDFSCGMQHPTHTCMRPAPLGVCRMPTHTHTHPHTCCCGVAACTQLKCAMNHTCLQLPLATTLHLSLGHTSVTPLENRHTCHTAATPVSLPAGNTAGPCHFSHLCCCGSCTSTHTPNTLGSTAPPGPHRGFSRAVHLWVLASQKSPCTGSCARNNHWLCATGTVWGEWKGRGGVI
jgi:hypothetical protein